MAGDVLPGPNRQRRCAGLFPDFFGAEKRGQDARHRLPMGPRPVDFAAARAHFKLALIFKHIPGNHFANFSSWDQIEHLVTEQAAGQQGRECGSPDRLKNLANLILDPIAFKKNEAIYRFADQQPGIARQENAFLLSRYGDQLIVSVTVGVQDVESGDAEPLGQPTQHHVGDESWRNQIGGQFRRLGVDLI